MEIKKYLKIMIDRNASDMFFRAGANVRMRIDGRVVAIDDKIVSLDEDYEDFIGTYVDEQLNCINKPAVDINQLEIPFGSRKKNIKKTPQEPCDVQVNPHIQQFVNDNQSLR